MQTSPTTNDQTNSTTQIPYVTNKNRTLETLGITRLSKQNVLDHQKILSLSMQFGRKHTGHIIFKHKLIKSWLVRPCRYLDCSSCVAFWNDWYHYGNLNKFKYDMAIIANQKGSVKVLIAIFIFLQLLTKIRKSILLRVISTMSLVCL